MQLQKLHTQPESVQHEFDALKEHLDAYISNSTAAPLPRSTRKPTRHISHLTQMAAKALHRDVPGMATMRGKRLVEKGKVEWDELGEYQAKGSWRDLGLESGVEDVEMMRRLGMSREGGVTGLEKRWGRSWEGHAK